MDRCFNRYNNTFRNNCYNAVRIKYTRRHFNSDIINSAMGFRCFKMRKWIQKAVKNKGSLTKWAKEHGFYKDGKIQLNKALKYAKRHHLSKRIKQIYLAKTLSKLRKKRNR